MRLIAIHDSEGRIHALVASPPNSPPGMVGTTAGQFMTEVEVPEVMEFDQSDPQQIDNQLAELTESHVVEVEQAKGSLSRKTEEAPPYN